MAGDVIEERAGDGEGPGDDALPEENPVIRHSKLILEKIEVAVSGNIGMGGFFELGKGIAEKHASLAGFAPFLGIPFLDALICETAFDLVEAMSQTCGYEELRSFYSTAYGLLMQGFAVGLDFDLDIRECTETEDGVESGLFRDEFEGFNDKDEHWWLVMAP